MNCKLFRTTFCDKIKLFKTTFCKNYENFVEGGNKLHHFYLEAKKDLPVYIKIPSQ